MFLSLCHIKKFTPMKKMIFAVLFLGATTPLFAQFVPPTYPLSEEYAYPTAPMGMVSRTFHTAAYSSGHVDFPDAQSDLFVYSWSGLKAGIAWRRTVSDDPAMLDEGALQMPQSEYIQELEVAIVSDLENQVYVIASYYNTNVQNPGHFYNVYTWDQTGLTLQSENQLSTATDYGRISIDAHGRYLVGIVWQESTPNGEVIKAKIGQRDPGGSGMVFGDNCEISSAAGGMIPDIAFTHPNFTQTTASVRIIYVDGTGNIVTGQTNYSNLLSGSASLITDDINYGIYSWITPAQSRFYSYSPQYPNLDCPEHTIDMQDQWAYIYMPDHSNIHARIMYNGGINTYKLTDGSIYTPAINNSIYHMCPTIAYYPDGDKIFFGWIYNYSSPSRQYVAVLLNVDGTPFMPGYQIVPNSSDCSPAPAFAFAKETVSYWSTGASRLLCVYAMKEPLGDYYLKLKLRPWTWVVAPFSQSSSVGEDQTEPLSVSAFPNPFYSEFALTANENQPHAYTVQLVDIRGKVLAQYNGKLEEINKGLALSTKPLSSGIYLVKVGGNDYQETFKVIKQ